MRIFYFLFIILLSTTQYSFAQQQTLLKGMVTEIEVVSDSLNLAYSIYLPPNYTKATASKVLFVLDPNGDGMRAARLFVSAIAGEEYVVVSNNFKLSKNLDSLDTNAQQAVTMMRDVFAKVALESGQVYITGLGSGAKTASALSYVLKNTAGILVIDDIYFAEQYIEQASGNAVIGVVGDSSPSYYQMANHFNMMKSLNNYNELYTYSDTGAWPSANFLGILINRLNHFQTDRFNLQVADSIWQRNYNSDLEALDKLVLKGEYLTAYDLSQDLKSDYRGNVSLDKLKDFYKDLRRTDAYKTAKRANRSGNLQELLLLEDIQYFLDEDITLANFENLGYWDSRISNFKNSADNATMANEQKVAHRMLGYISYTIEDFLTLNKVGLIPQRIFGNVLATMLDARDYQAYLNIISLSAQDDDDNTAYFYLEELLKQGFTDYESLYAIPETTTLKIKPTYNQIIANYLGKSKF
ncbi:hypothetical protein [Leeuwenhoekiella sp. LLG6367-2.1]|uniref:hypothetical protein n=1 Tax=Leeuwenhoekiella sp. LLG6367-2.1 TaxID=3160833 RepID=UPI00386E74CC